MYHRNGKIILHNNEPKKLHVLKNVRSHLKSRVDNTMVIILNY